VNSSLDETIVNFVETSSAQDYGDAIAYFGFSYYSQEGALLYGVPIQNEAGRFVAPSRSSITDDSYNPLSRKLYLQLWNNDASLAVTRPFLAYGLSQRGTQIADNVGMVTLSFEARSIVLQRLGLTVTNLSAPSSPIGPPLPVMVPSKAPTNRPSRAPLAKACGFRLFCRLKCSLVRRIFGLCRN
jgi:hypothetical protein